MSTHLRLLLCLSCLVLISTSSPNKPNTPKSNILSPSAFAKLITEQNPEGFTMVECAINDLILIIQTRPDWSPLGQQRFIELVNDRYYDNTALFRAIKNFLVQFGLASTKSMRDKWAGRDAQIKDDPSLNIPFKRGVMSFAGSGKNTRGTQIFFTMAEYSSHLGKEPWETPFGRVIYGDEALQSINTEYDDSVSQGRIWRDGYEYLRNEVPNLSYIEYCRTINENEMMYYLKSVNGENVEGNSVGKIMEGLGEGLHKNVMKGVNGNAGVLNEDIEHDLQKQLYGDVEEGQSGAVSDAPLLLVVEVIGVLGVIVALVYVVMKLVKKTPNKNH